MSASIDVVKQVGPAIAVKVIEDAAAGQVRASDPQAGPRRDVLEPAHIKLRAERVSPDQIRGRDLAGILAQRHVSEVQQPAATQVAGGQLQVGA